KVFRTLKEKQEEFQMTMQQQEQQKLDQEAQIAQAQLEQTREMEDKRMRNENINKELDRISKEKIAVISALGFGKVEGEDVDNNLIYDALESGKLDLEREKILNERRDKLFQIQNENKRESEKLKLE